MALPQGINFRGSSGFVTDGANEDFDIDSTVTYPRTSAQGNSIGYENVGSGITTKNRNAALDQRIAGDHFMGSSGVSTYRIDLPASGSYNVRLSAGDTSLALPVFVELFDTTSSLGVLANNGAPGSGTPCVDATNTAYSTAAWPGSNTAVAKTFSTTICRFKNGDGLNPTAIQHFYIESAGGASGNTVGSVTGVGTVVGVGNAVWNAVGNSAGTSTAVGVSQTSNQIQTVGTSTGTGTAVGISNTVKNAAGTSTGLGTGVGVSNTVTNAVGNAAGTVSVAGVGLAVQPGQMVGASDGIATVSGVAITIANAVGNASGTSDAQGVNPQVVVNQIGVIVGGGGELTWRDHVKAIHDKRMLEGRIREQKKELKKVEKKLKSVEKKIESKEKPEGILATYLELELKKDEIENKIHAFEVDLEPLIMAIQKMEIEDDDNEFMSLQ